MKFLWPTMLLWLLAVPALVAAYVYWMRRKKKGAIRYPSLALLKEAMGPGERFRRPTKKVVCGCAWRSSVQSSCMGRS